MKKLHVIVLFGTCLLPVGLIASPVDNDHRFEYRVLATKKTSTMEKEVNAAASKGFRFEGVMGGETALGGAETVVLMSSKDHQAYPAGFEHKLLATNKTSTMQKELQAAAVLGYEYRGQTVFETAFGGGRKSS